MSILFECFMAFCAVCNIICFIANSPELMQLVILLCIVSGALLYGFWQGCKDIYTYLVNDYFQNFCNIFTRLFKD